MLETLLVILSWHVPQGAPEIMLEDDGDICLSWYDPEGVLTLEVSINKAGGVNWAGGPTRTHGNTMTELRKVLMGE
jgi:hypothetical protein